MTSPARYLSQRDADVISLEFYWRTVFPEYPVPTKNYLHGWLKRVALEDVMLLLDQLQSRIFDSAEHLGKVISSMVRQIADGEIVRTIPDQN